MENTFDALVQEIWYSVKLPVGFLLDSYSYLDFYHRNNPFIYENSCLISSLQIYYFTNY